MCLYHSDARDLRIFSIETVVSFAITPVLAFGVFYLYLYAPLVAAILLSIFAGMLLCFGGTLASVTLPDKIESGFVTWLHVILMVFVVGLNFTLIIMAGLYATNTPLPLYLARYFSICTLRSLKQRSDISVANISAYPQKSVFKFYDGNILIEYRQCGNINFTQEDDPVSFHFGAVAPLVPSAQNFSLSDAIPAFVLTWSVDEGCNIQPDANWDEPIQEGQRIETGFLVDNFITNRFANMTITKNAPKNVIIWKYAEEAVRELRSAFQRTFVTSFCVYAILYLLVVLFIFVKWAKAKLATEGTHVRYESLE